MSSQLQNDLDYQRFMSLYRRPFVHETLTAVVTMWRTTAVLCGDFVWMTLCCSGSWMDVWELMSQECRDEVVLIDSACLLETLETYLCKHR